MSEQVPAESRSFAGSEVHNVEEESFQGAQSPRLPSQVSRVYPGFQLTLGERTSAVLSAGPGLSNDDGTALSAAEMAGEHSSQPQLQNPVLRIPPSAILRVVRGDETAQSNGDTASPGYRTNNINISHAAVLNRIAKGQDSTARLTIPIPTSPRLSKSQLAALASQPRGFTARTSAGGGVTFRPTGKYVSGPLPQTGSFKAGTAGQGGSQPLPASGNVMLTMHPSTGSLNINVTTMNNNVAAQPDAAEFAAPPPMVPGAGSALDNMTQAAAVQQVTNNNVPTRSGAGLNQPGPSIEHVGATGQEQNAVAALSACSPRNGFAGSVVDGQFGVPQDLINAASKVPIVPPQHKKPPIGSTPLQRKASAMERTASVDKDGRQGGQVQPLPYQQSSQAAVARDAQPQVEEIKREILQLAVPQAAQAQGNFPQPTARGTAGDANDSFALADHPAASVLATVITASGRDDDGGSELQQPTVDNQMQILTAAGNGNLASGVEQKPVLGERDGAPSSLAVMSTGIPDGAGSIGMSGPHLEVYAGRLTEEELSGLGERKDGGGVIENGIEGTGGSRLREEQPAMATQEGDDRRHQPEQPAVEHQQLPGGVVESRGTARGTIVAPAHSVMTTAAANNVDNLDDRTEALSPILAEKAAKAAAAAGVRSKEQATNNNDMSAPVDRPPAQQQQQQQGVVMSTLATIREPKNDEGQNTCSGQDNLPPLSIDLQQRATAALEVMEGHGQAPGEGQTISDKAYTATATGATAAARSVIQNGAPCNSERELTSPSRLKKRRLTKTASDT